MKNKELISNFINGESKGKCGNLSIKGNKLINYYTCIAYRIGNQIYLNAQKYSQTTTKNQNILRRESYNITEYETENIFNSSIAEY